MLPDEMQSSSSIVDSIAFAFENTTTSNGDSTVAMREAHLCGEPLFTKHSGFSPYNRKLLTEQQPNPRDSTTTETNPTDEPKIDDDDWYWMISKGDRPASMNNITTSTAPTSTEWCAAEQSTRRAIREKVPWDENFGLLVAYPSVHNQALAVVTSHPSAVSQALSAAVTVVSSGSTPTPGAARHERWDKKWMKMYDSLVEYKEKHKTTIVTRVVPLRKWTGSQRCKYKNGKLSEDQIALLDSIGFRWTRVNNDQWMEMYELLVAHKEKYNTTCVPKGWEGNPSLARWTSLQRRRCKLKDRVDLLNEIGFVWNVLDYNWMVMYDLLVVYKEKYKHTRVPIKFKNCVQLGRWVSTQRLRCENPHRIDILNKIGFEWNVLKIYDQSPSK